MAAAGEIALTNSNFRLGSLKASAISSPVHSTNKVVAELLEFTSIFHGRELTRKNHRIPSGLRHIDDLIEGGIIKGRISEIIAQPGAGKTSLAAAFATNVTRREAVAWIDAADDFDPASIAAAGVELTRLLWVSCCGANKAASLKAAEWILAAGGFGLVILDFGASSPQLSQSAALRLARAAERSEASVLVLASHRLCGTFAALSLTLRCKRVGFSNIWPGTPTLFDGQLLEACVTRNKLGRSGRTVKWRSVVEDNYGLKTTGMQLAAANQPQAI